MTVESLGRMYVASDRTTTLNLSPAGGSPACNPTDEVSIRAILTSHADRAADYRGIDGSRYADGWSGADLDPTPHRVLWGSPPLSAPDLQGGQATVGVRACYDPETRQPLMLDIESNEGNLESHVRWKDGQFLSSVDRRILADGSRESLELTYNAATGVLTCLEQRLPPVTDSAT